jgi:pSer/pThr/pTyr-binding forkhead associated (FHA) protein
MNEQLISGDVKPQFALLVDPHTGQEFRLYRFATCIGRSSSCDVSLSDKAVSRQHAVVYCLNNKFFIEDVGSTNGTMVNSKPINARVALNPGDEVRLGITRLVFLQIPDRSAVGKSFVGTKPAIIREYGNAPATVAAGN